MRTITYGRFWFRFELVEELEVGMWTWAFYTNVAMACTM